MTRLAVFASGSGSNFQAIVDAVNEGLFDAEVALLVCNKPGAKVIERAETAGIPAFVTSPGDYSSKAEFEKAIVSKLEENRCEWIILAGYMRLVGPTLLEHYEGRIVNIHPSLLPAFPGLDAIGQAMDKGVKITGVTVHYVDSGMDTGPIIAQKAVTIEEGDTRESVQKKVQKVEHILYPQTIGEIIALSKNVK
ncbi:phosphoribosylglycinamide formyltransferase [Alteribacter keqinensis]|uniref:Phosphoribosylglycinamide formyltransferase n=1 Tax=Alteribacter keqinensis TaxID=2483800 RepID=A0A3M7TNY7_9BACI|nr:phosphoribosylglycinamide formyltransferase [Alteribacter keqinensis]RNA66727.1 phosphoribosylglycinamide formyltransferase [Alteribacter keqinensis]